MGLVVARQIDQDVLIVLSPGLAIATKERKSYGFIFAAGIVDNTKNQFGNIHCRPSIFS